MAKSATTGAEAASPVRIARILVVDDDPDSLALLECLLTAGGYEPRTATSAPIRLRVGSRS